MSTRTVDPRTEAGSRTLRRATVEDRLGREKALRRRELESHPQSMGDGKKWLPLQLLEPFMGGIRGLLRGIGVYEAMARRTTRPRMVERDVWLLDAEGDLDGFRILHLSDLHIDAWAGMGRALAERIEALEFDLAVVTGDLRLDTRGGLEGVQREMRDLLPSLKRAHAPLAVLGNHDALDMVPILEDLGLDYLLNESRRLAIGDRHLSVVGVDDAHFYGSHDVDAAFAGVPDSDLVLFLCHSPDLIVEAAAAWADFYLCGHTHGGQICLPGGKPLLSNASCTRRFARGGWIHGSMRGYTSSGIGFSGIPLRTFCRGELVVHVLRKERRNRRRVAKEREDSLLEPVFLEK